MDKFFTLPAMLFLHVFDDFCLQAILLNKLKQKSWWRGQTADPKYQYDFIVGLLAHSFSWAFSIMFPIAVYFKFNPTIDFYLALVANMAVHYVTDDIKANKLAINLVTDQTIHTMQILVTFLLLVILPAR